MTESAAGDDTLGDTSDDTAGSASNEAGISDEELDAERAERLAEENRPDQAAVDNTDKEFDPEKGMFTDSEGYDEAEAKFAPEGEQGA